MKSSKLANTAITACLLVGASSAAMAESCHSGNFDGAELSSLSVDGRACTVTNTIISGNVWVKNSEEFILVDSVVGGKVTVTQGGSAVISRNEIDGTLTVERMEHAVIILNRTDGNTQVNDNNKANVKKNFVFANLLCEQNRRLDSFENEVTGTENCR
jgi:hypothetical protein